jgi:hypothetical protein
MVPFYTKFPNLAETEMRVFTTFGDPHLPDGRYGFMESFCDDPNCDCHRVLISVISDNNPGKIYATINYGWKDKKFYSNFLGDDNPFVSDNELNGPYLDDLNPQSEYASTFLGIFANLLKDQRYVDRLERHYNLFKETFYKKNKATNIVDIKKKTKKKIKQKLAKVQRKKNR